MSSTAAPDLPTDEVVPDPTVADPAVPVPAPEAAPAHRDARHTRISGAWAAVAAGVLLGVALIDFLVQNTRSVKVEFFSVSGRMPVAVGFLAAALAGAAVVLIVGVCRTAQLRLVIRRGRKAASVAPVVPDQAHG